MNFEVIPRKPITTIHSTAPGPPIPIAIATPAMFPSPTVADRAVESAWKCVIWPGSSLLEYLPRTVLIANPKARRLMKPK